MSIKAVSRFGKDRQSGQTRAPRYASKALHTPAKMQVSTTASNTLRFGFSTSSASVVTPSNPMYVRAANEVAVKTRCASNVAGLYRGWVESIPAHPCPPYRYRMATTTNHATTADITASNTLLERAEDFIPARFSNVMIPAMIAAHTMYGIIGK